MRRYAVIKKFIFFAPIYSGVEGVGGRWEVCVCVCVCVFKRKSGITKFSAIFLRKKLSTLQNVFI